MNRQNGVTIEQDGRRLEIYYKGELAELSPDKLYLHAGVGDNDNWQDIKDIEMKKIEDKEVKYKASIRINTDKILRFCFKTDDNKVDDNDGFNWSYDQREEEFIKIYETYAAKRYTTSITVAAKNHKEAKKKARQKYFNHPEAFDFMPVTDGFKIEGTDIIVE